jgi:hypothetical protein
MWNKFSTKQKFSALSVLKTCKQVKALLIFLIVPVRFTKHSTLHFPSLKNCCKEISIKPFLFPSVTRFKVWLFYIDPNS